MRYVFSSVHNAYICVIDSKKALAIEHFFVSLINTMDPIQSPYANKPQPADVFVLICI
jgi:hypothetical protein